MISKFQSHEFRFDLDLTDIQLGKLNAFKIWKSYIDKEVASEVLNTHDKKSLSKTPFIKRFEFGFSADGYWTYNNMVIQFKDVIDVIMSLFPQFDVVEVFDHSSGHAKKQIDVLYNGNINKYHGGSQPIINDSVIMSVDGYLGPYDYMLKFGDEQ